MKRGPAGVMIQVFEVRRGRVVERIELASEASIVGGSDGEVLEAALQQFYELRTAPAEIHADGSVTVKGPIPGPLFVP